MSDHRSTPQAQFSLHDEIKKRKAEAARHDLAERQTARTPDTLPPARTVPPTAPASHSAHPVIAPLPPRPVPTAAPARPVDQAGDRASSVASRSPKSGMSAASPARQLGGRLARGQMRLPFGVAAVFAVLLLAGIVVIASSDPAAVEPTPTLPPLPAVSASDVLTYFKGAGVTVSNVREFPAPNDSFEATGEIQFEVYRGQDKGLFIVLSYPSAEQRTADLFKVEASSRFRPWARMPVSNVMMLTSPDTAPALRSELADRLMQYLVAPYRPHYATSTPAVTPTAAP